MLLPNSLKKRSIDPITRAKIASRFDFACRVFNPTPPTKYEVEVERQHLRRHGRIVQLSHYKTGNPWTRR
jgi:hypothetical protein